MGRTVTKFQIKVDGMLEGNWSFGACLSHGWGETYLYINLFKWSISIGWLNYYDNTAEPYKGVE
jgi:hypothetical protein